AAVGGYVVGVGRPPGPRLHERGHPFAPLLVGDTDNDGVEHVGVALDRRLDLLGIHLLAAGVDAHRAPPEHEHGAVGLDGGHVAGEHPAHAVDLLEGRRRLHGVVVVTEGDVALEGDATHDTRARLHGLEVVVEHGSALVHGEAQTLLGAGFGRHRSLVAGL